MNPCMLIHGYGRDQLPLYAIEPTPLSPEEYARINEVKDVASDAQLDLLSGLQGLGDLMGSAAPEAVPDNVLASCACLVANVARIIDGFRLLQEDMSYRLRMADHAAEPPPSEVKA